MSIIHPYCFGFKY